MSEKIILFTDNRSQAAVVPAVLQAPTGDLRDQLARPLHDLRISVTDRCNFRCVYCMPKEVFDKDYNYLPHSSLLSFEEITRIAKIFIAHGVGLGPIKVNMVVKGGMNDQEILPMARYFKNTPYILRFIEYMDVGASNGWKLDEVVPSAEVARRIGAELPIEPIAAYYAAETAERWRYRDGRGEIGLISSVTQAFCQNCTRARLSTEGKLYTCLFATRGHDLRALLRDGSSDEQIAGAVSHLWQARGDRYSELRTSQTAGIAKKVEMSYIGG
jgi:molybdenum cofactor biosynthesis enzyme MoaA